jgi:hypothetical protein
MNLYLSLGVAFTTVALGCYSLFYWRNRKLDAVSKGACLVQTTGLEFDIAGTVLMILGSRNIPLTVHGVIGYSALAAMLVKTVLVWRRALGGGANGPSARIAAERKYGTIAYAWWVLAYVAGGAIAMLGLPA